MVQENTIHQHRFYINDEEIKHDSSGSISFSGNNQLNSLNIKIDNTDLQNQALDSKRVKLFLNKEDTIPLFSGIITDYNPTAEGISIKCVDVRGWISGKNGYSIELTDEDNYDGYDISNFLHTVISDKVNTNKTHIGLDKLNSISPPLKSAFVTDLREKGAIYDIATKIIKGVIDVTDYQNPLTYFFDIVEGYDIGHLVIKKDKAFTEEPSIIYSYDDGLIEYKYKKRSSINTGVYEGGQFTYTNTPDGSKTIPIVKEDVESRAELRNIAIEQVLLENQTDEEITIKVSHGYYIGLGSIVRLDITEEGIKGNHRVTGKKISFGKSIDCTLNLGKAPPKLGDYLQ